MWPSADATDALVPEDLLARLIAWQRAFDDDVHRDTGRTSTMAETRWAAEAAVLEADLRVALAGKVDLVVDLWPLHSG